MALTRPCFVLQFSLVIAVALNTYIVSLGFGSHIWTISDENLKKINLDTIIVAAFGIISTTTGKTSFAITLYRITETKWMKWFLIFVIITVNLFLNFVWIFGLAKCTPFARVYDKSVPGTCWDLQRLAKFQLFAACKLTHTHFEKGEADTICRLLRNPRLRPRFLALAGAHGSQHEAS